MDPPPPAPPTENLLLLLPLLLVAVNPPLPFAWHQRLDGGLLLHHCRQAQKTPERMQAFFFTAYLQHPAPFARFLKIFIIAVPFSPLHTPVGGVRFVQTLKKAS